MAWSNQNSELVTHYFFSEHADFSHFTLSLLIIVRLYHGCVYGHL